MVINVWSKNYRTSWRKKVGIHPDRIKKLMISTNISGKKLKDTGYKFHYTLEESFRDWYKDCEEKGLY